MRIRTAKAADIRFILKLSDQINRQHHQGAPNVFSSPDKSTNGSEAYWLGLMLEPEGHFLVAGFFSWKNHTEYRCEFYPRP